MTQPTLIELSRRLAQRRDDKPRLDRGQPRAHRRSKGRRRARLSDGLRRQGAKRGRRRRRRPREGRSPAAFRRRSAVDQGPVRRRRRADSRRLARARRGAGGSRRRRGGGARAPRGLRHRRQDQHDRIRLFGLRRECALRDAVEPLGSRARPYSRRLDLGRSGRRRRRHDAGDARHRHRRLVPHPRGLLRHRRLPANSGPRVAAGGRSARPEPRFGRAAGDERVLLRRRSTASFPAAPATTSRPRRSPASPSA